MVRGPHFQLHLYGAFGSSETGNAFFLQRTDRSCGAKFTDAADLFGASEEVANRAQGQGWKHFIIHRQDLRIYWRAFSMELGFGVLWPCFFLKHLLSHQQPKRSEEHLPKTSVFTDKVHSWYFRKLNCKL